jgi:hypothetical protein
MPLSESTGPGKRNHRLGHFLGELRRHGQAGIQMTTDSTTGEQNMRSSGHHGGLRRDAQQYQLHLNPLSNRDDAMRRPGAQT